MAARERWRTGTEALSRKREIAAQAERLAAQLGGGAEEREAALSAIFKLEAEHSSRHANRLGAGSVVPTAIHVGGLEGPALEDEGALAELFGRFGTVLAVTLRVRREVKDGKQVVSWALVSFSSAEEAQAALTGTKDLAATHSALVTRKMDEVQAAHSTGGMGNVMRKHITARAAAVRESKAVADIAVACASPLCALLCKDLSEVGVEEYRRAGRALIAISTIDPTRVGGECTRPDQCSIWDAWLAPNSALGVALAKVRLSVRVAHIEIDLPIVCMRH
jgi:hypothetical protein